MFGWIMPLPLAVPPTVTVLPPISTRTAASLVRVSVVRMASAKPAPSRSRPAATPSIPAEILVHRQVLPDDTRGSHGDLSSLYSQSLGRERLHLAGVLEPLLPGRRIGVAAVRHYRPHVTALHGLPRNTSGAPLTALRVNTAAVAHGVLGEEEAEIPPPSSPVPHTQPRRHEARRRRYSPGERLYSDC